MKRKLLLTLTLSTSSGHALALEPMLSLKGLFRQVPDKLSSLLSQEDKLLRSEFDRVEGGVKSEGAGVSLVTSEQDIESFACLLPDCSSMNGVSMSQDRGGLAWNLSPSDSFRLAPRAEVVRYQINSLAQTRGESDIGFGVGLDSLYRIGSQVSAYASAGMLQLNQRSGYEGLFGVSTQLKKSKLFVEARWAEMNQAERLDADYEFNNIRIGISREFSGL